MKTKVIYIVGSGHSGSTLLDLLLGSHSRIESVGEARGIGRIMTSDRNPRVHSGGLKNICTCGALFTECQFWHPIAERIRARGFDEDTFLQVSSSAETDNEIFISEVLRQSGKSVYAESTKSVPRLEALRRVRSLNVFVVHLIRDGRAIAYSNLLKGRNLYKWAHRWSRQNIAILREKDRTGDQWITVRYEDLVARPVEEMKAIMKFAGEEFEPGQMMFSSFVHHNLAGNRMRHFGSSEIRPDTNYLRALTPQQWLITTAIAYPGLVACGYPLSRKQARILFQA
jgi:hypothetical protein